MKALIRLHVLRHGEPQPPGIFYGHSDVELSPLGHEQVRAQAAAFADIRLAEVWTSDLGRARIGAEAIAGAAPVVVSPQLREMHLGVLELVALREAAERFPDLVGVSFHDMLDRRFEGGGESVRDVALRVLPFVEANLRRVARPHATIDVALYAHNTVNRIVLAAACGLDASGYVRFAQDYAARSRIDFDLARMRDDALWNAAAIAYMNLPAHAVAPPG